MIDLCANYGKKLIRSVPESSITESMCLCEDGLGHILFKNEVFTEQHVKSYQNRIDELTRDVLLSWVVDTRPLIKTTPGVMKYLWSREYNKRLKYTALIAPRNTMGYVSSLSNQFKVFRQFLDFKYKFRVMLDSPDIMNQATEWLLRRTDDNLIHALIELGKDEVNLVNLGALLVMKSQKDAAMMYGVTRESLSRKNREEFLMSKLGTTNLIRIIEHLQYIPKLYQRVRLITDTLEFAEMKKYN